MGKLNFRGYLISRFYPTREIREIMTHAKNMFYSSLIFVFTKFSDTFWCELNRSVNPGIWVEQNNVNLHDWGVGLHLN